MLKEIFNFKNYDWKKYNVSLLVVALILCIISANILKLEGGEQMGSYYFKHQLIGAGLGLVIAVGISLIDYHFVCRFAIIYYMIGTLMVAATRFSPFGLDHDTSQYRWLKIGIEFQPSELCKIILVLSLAALFVRLQNRLNRLSTFFIVVLVAAVPTYFVLIQSDLSSSLVMMFILAIMIFASGLSYRVLLPIIGILIPLVLVTFWYIQQPNQRVLNKYQYDRVDGFLHPEKHDLDSMFQQNMSVNAIASGKVTGKIFDGATETKRNYEKVGVTESDFVFAVIGEEVGFVGSFVVIALMAVIIIKCILISMHSCDFLGRMISMGIAAMLMFQVFANIGVATKLLPNTGLPLPFLSYGLSSMVSCMIGLGFVLNIGLQTNRKFHDGFTLENLNEV